MSPSESQPFTSAKCKWAPAQLNCGRLHKQNGYISLISNSNWKPNRKQFAAPQACTDRAKVGKTSRLSSTPVAPCYLNPSVVICTNLVLQTADDSPVPLVAPPQPTAVAPGSPAK